VRYARLTRPNLVPSLWGCSGAHRLLDPNSSTTALGDPGAGVCAIFGHWFDPARPVRLIQDFLETNSIGPKQHSQARIAAEIDMKTSLG